MRLSRIISAAVGVLALVAIPAAAAQAQEPYPPVAPSLTANPTTVTVGDPVTLSGRGFGLSETVDLSVSTRPLAAGAGHATNPNGSTGTRFVTVAYRMPGAPKANTVPRQVRADGNGEFSVVVRFHDPGVVTITATGETSGRSASVEIRVLPSGGLPVTGSDLNRTATIGGSLLATGTALVLGAFLWRRRRGGRTMAGSGGGRSGS
jgi:hypothetical protein